MITNNIYKKLVYKSFNRFSNFALIGNDIDGFINIDIVKFENFEEVKENLPLMINSLKFEGEWNLSLYQIPNDFKIKHLYGYYRVPKKGKLILELSYMNICRNIGIFITDSLIHVFSKTNLWFERQSKNKEPNGELYEDFITVLLYEKNKLRRREINETYTIDNQDFYKRFLPI